jgi:phenylalanine-4-hydroxylase
MNTANGADKSTLRGDYTHAAADFSVAQDMTRYSAAEHARYRRLYTRQRAQVPSYACEAFAQALRAMEERLDVSKGIPNFAAVSDMLEPATGWRLVAVPGLIPDDVFFGHLAARRFPVTVWLREEAEFDYIVEPDVFHDFFGHVPLLLDRTYADYLQAYGAGGLKAKALGGLTYLARLYWYTIEFGLMHTAQGVRAYGAGLLSSGGELPYSLRAASAGPSDAPDEISGEASGNTSGNTSGNASDGHVTTLPEAAPTAPRHEAFRLMDVMRAPYEIDRYQDRYFVIDDFQQLLDDTAPDFSGYYAALRQAEA